MATLPISVQLYTLRDSTSKDMPGVLKRLASIGYRYVEVAGYGNLSSAAEMRKAADDAGVAVSGAHVGLEVLETKLDAALDEVRTLGTTNVIVPWLDPKRRGGVAVWTEVAASVSSISEKARRAELDVLYHNHDFEFASVEGTTPMEVLLSKLDGRVKIELDTYWVQFAGQDPIAWINRLGNRLPLLHLKDMTVKGSEKRFAPIGTGVMDFKAIVAAGKRVGVKFGVVEQDDTYELDPLKAVEISMQNLKKMGLVE